MSHNPKTAAANERTIGDLKDIIEKNNLGESFTHKIGEDGSVNYAPTIYNRNDPRFQEKMRVNMIARAVTDKVYGPGAPNDPEIMRKVGELEAAEQSKKLHEFILSLPKGDVAAYECAMSLFPEIRAGAYQLMDERFDRLKGSIKRKLEGPIWMFLFEQFQGNIAEDDTSFFFTNVEDPKIEPIRNGGWLKNAVVNFVSGSGIWTSKSNKTGEIKGATLDDSTEYFMKKLGLSK